MWRATAMGLFFATGLAWGVFYLENAVRQLGGDLTRTRDAYNTTVRKVHVLKADWSYLNRPERLALLARRHLDLRPVVSPQIVSLDQIPLHTSALGGGGR